MSAPGTELELEEAAESLSPVATDERTYGRYLLQYEIASGGMASVYLARALGVAGFERPIAIKRIHPHLAKKPIFVDMFMDEARLNARIAHPNVCSVFDFGEADGTYFMAMEYLVGQPLSRVLGAVAVRPELAASTRWHALAARILADACQGLHAAHELVDDHGYPLQVIHRDFTPHNVFVTYDGAVKVFDFGVARSEGRVHQTETGMLKGKLAYMSPEQLARAPIDRRLDVWAAGVCLWELLTLRRLFGKRSEIEIVQAIATEPILEPSHVRAGVPRELDLITLRALERDPDRRTNSARILARELNQYVSTTGVSTSLADVAELMAELFPEERARKLDVVAGVLRSEDGVDLSDTSSVQRSPPRSSAGSIAAPRGPSRLLASPSMRTPASMRAPAEEAALARAPSQRPLAPPRLAEDVVAEEATTQSAVELADMLEPPSERSLTLRLDLPEHQSSSPPSPLPAASVSSPGSTRWERRWALGAAIAALATLFLAAFLVVATGVLDPSPAPEPLEAVATSSSGPVPPSSLPPDPPPSPPEGSAAPAPPASVPPADPEAPTLATPTLATPTPPPPVESEEPATDPASDDEVAPGRARRGAVNIAARGGWADLFVDGRPAGRTPRSLALPPGRHLVELRAPGRAPIRRAVTVQSGRTQRLVIDL